MVKQLELQQQLYTIPFGHWGIYSGLDSQQLYKPDSDGIRPIDKVPLKMWDTLRTVHIELNGHEIEKYNGFFSISSSVRGQRPVEEGKENPASVESRRAVLQKIIDGEDFSIPISVDGEQYDSSFSTNPQKIKLGSHKAVTIINRFSPYARVLDPRIEEEVNKNLEGSKYKRIAKGVCLLAFPTRYSEQLEETPKDRIAAMLFSLQKSLFSTVDEAMQRGSREIPVYVFINTKDDAGRSLPWLHTQAYVDTTQDGHGGITESILKAFEDQRRNHGCELCKLGKGKPTEEGTVVYKTPNGHFSLYVPNSQKRSYHIRATPSTHLENIPDDASLISDLADVLYMGNIALTKLGLEGRYIAIRQRPFGYKSFFHVFVDIMPVEVIGTAEVMEDCRMTRITRESVVNNLKAILN